MGRDCGGVVAALTCGVYLEFLIDMVFALVYLINSICVMFYHLFL